MEKTFKELLEVAGYPVLDIETVPNGDIIYTIPSVGEDKDFWDKLINLLNTNGVPKDIFPMMTTFLYIDDYTTVCFINLPNFDRTDPEDLIDQMYLNITL